MAGRIKQLLKKYEINDDRIFGAMLYEGEYINLVKIIKNDETRAHDNWADVIKNMPAGMGFNYKMFRNEIPI